MPEIVTDYAVTYNWKAYKNGNNVFTISLTQNGGAFDISSYTFILNIRTPYGEINRLQLTQGSGITNGGASGTITITLTQNQASVVLPRDYYFWELSYTFDGITYRMFSGGLTLSTDTNTSTTTAIGRDIRLAGTQVLSNITVAGLTQGAIVSVLGYTPADDAELDNSSTSEVIEVVYLGSAYKTRVEADGGTFEGMTYLETQLRKLQNIDIE